MEQARRILVVDDEPLVCESMKLLLRSDGHEVRTASSGPEALAALERHKYDVVIVDYAMPGMKGDELAARIKERSPDQPVIMITVYAETLESSSKPMPGFDALISKPFRMEDLRESIARVLAKAQRSGGTGKSS